MDLVLSKQYLLWVDYRKVFCDGQEDAGAVPTDVETLPSLSMADEFSEVAALVSARKFVSIQ